ncbi:MAG: alpha/beta fold hydrolase [Candidatus Micrarchaeota archaeon]
MKNKKAFIFHCWGGQGRNCWRGWLADQLTVLGFEVLCPDFPNTNEPQLEEWMAEVRKHVKRFDENWILVGHSLGCPTILRVLESLDEDERIGGAFLVAGFAKDLGIPETRSFMEKEFDWEKINSKCEKFVVINSDNDPFIELKEGERLAKLLNTKLITEHNAGHINQGGGWTKYPRLLDLIKNPD